MAFTSRYSGTNQPPPHRDPFHDVGEGLVRENLSVHGERPQHDLLGGCFDARKSVATQCLDLVARARRVYANPTKNSVQQDIEVGRMLKKTVDEKAAVLEALRARVSERRGEVTREISLKLKPATQQDNQTAAEVRAHLRGLSDDARYKLIESVLKTDEAKMMFQAVVSAPAFLSGVVPGKHEQLRQDYLAIVAPEYLGLEKALDAEAVKLKKGAEGVRRMFAERFDFRRVDDLAKLAEDSTA